jgi:hypothetical protein
VIPSPPARWRAELPFGMLVGVRRLSFAGLFAALLAVLAGTPSCRTSEILEPSPAGVLVSAPPLEVTLAYSLRGWNETVSAYGTSRRFRLGKLFQHLFPARDGRAFLSPVEAKLDSRWDPGMGAWEASYDFALTLQLEGVSHELSARGAGSSADDPSAAERAAMEECVSQIYAQAAALLAGRGA